MANSASFENELPLRIIDLNFIQNLNLHLGTLKSIKDSMSVHDQMIWSQRKNHGFDHKQNSKVLQYLKADALKD